MRATSKEYVSKPVVDLSRYVKCDRWRLPFRHRYKPFVGSKRGIEMGGPSSVFRTVLPVDTYVRSLDGVNFSTATVWEGRIQAGERRAFFSDRPTDFYALASTE
jgi:hypothetical protein